MDCQKASILMMEYFDGTISQSHKASLMEHLKSCDNCSAEFSLLSESIELVENLEVLDPPENIEDTIMASIDVDKYKSKVKSWNVVLAFITVFTIAGGILVYITQNNLQSLQATFIASIIKIVNFSVLKLPQILSFIDGNLTLVLGIVIGISSLLLVTGVVIAIAEVYLINKFKMKLRRN